MCGLQLLLARNSARHAPRRQLAPFQALIERLAQQASSIIQHHTILQRLGSCRWWRDLKNQCIRPPKAVESPW